ncbi:LacI family DNA-binding transcriptional regulator [Bifidobacterium leontopitheci]|uniref:LacI family transcriptional regulator n=1 Tax=Bifidobacterium leontopitheci TaxID=2650774 RepID=A0A6I1GUK4_9BIFI|nr:LacI family DNA-binding transcriptional regulator [Bifidobacterium leontopitheci]KAB7790141.1 LacI family transcriptional regulator [Bifidobacterium leontopitheci]
MGAASITDVAVKANVSKATVSRVLSGRRNKEDDIARRVRQAAEQLNYQANAAASALRSDTTNIIGLVIHDPLDPFCARMVAELEPMVSDDGKQLLIGVGADAATQAERIDAMLARRVDGLAVIPPSDAGEPLPLDDYVGDVPLVQISGHSLSLHTNWVGVDESAAMKLVLSHLAAHNSTSVAFLSRAVDSSDAAQLLGTFQNSVSMMTMMTEPGWTTFGDGTAERGYRDAMELFGRRGPRPNGLICASDDVAIGAMMALARLGLDVPGDVKIIGSGDTPAAGTSWPTLTSIRPPCHLIAHETLRLIDVSGSKHWLPAHVAFPPQLVQRESTSSPRLGSSDMTAFNEG